MQTVTFIKITLFCGTRVAQKVRVLCCGTLVRGLESHQCSWTYVQVSGTRWLTYDAAHQEVGRCRTRHESEESITRR